MTRSDLVSPPDRVLVVGPRELDALHLLWERGPATVRQLHTWLNAEPPIACSTLQTICVTLTTKGLLSRRPAADTAARTPKGNPYIYEPTIHPATFRQVMVGRTQRLIAPYPAEAIPAVPTDTETNGSDEDMLAALRERVATAEHAAMLWEATAHRVARRIEAFERCAIAAERRAEQAERRADIAMRRFETLERQLNLPPKASRKPRTLGVIIGHQGPADICRVCGAPAPPSYSARTDDLRVCVPEVCRVEARRRDNAAKQRRYIARQAAARQAKDSA